MLPAALESVNLVSVLDLDNFVDTMHRVDGFVGPGGFGWLVNGHFFVF